VPTLFAPLWAWLWSKLPLSSFALWHGVADAVAGVLILTGLFPRVTPWYLGLTIVAHHVEPWLKALFFGPLPEDDWMSLRGLIYSLVLGQFLAVCLIAYDVGRRMRSIEREQRQHAAFIRIALDSINELANPGGSITEENTVEERKW
jgi:hypothetical protein